MWENGVIVHSEHLKVHRNTSVSLDGETVDRTYLFLKR